MRHAARHEPIGRAIGGSPIAVMTMADVVLRENAAYPEVKTFHCSTLRCDISPSACAANYTRGNAPLSCKGCPIGSAHAGGQNYRNESSNIHAKSDNAIGLSCLRCERNEHTATRFTGRFRLVRNHSLCISCVNREYECVKGTNSKGVAPRKWAHLQQATVTIEDAAGEWKTLDIGLRAGRGECERYVARIHPGFVLVEVFMGGSAIPAGVADPKPADWYEEAARKGHTTAKRKAKPLPVASDSEALDDEDDCWPPRNAAEVEPVESALDPESIAAHWDLTADGLTEFVQWLCEDWPVAPSVAVADTSAAEEVKQAVTDDSEWAGVIVRDGRGVEYDIAKIAARLEVAPEKIASEFGIPSNADIVFAGKTLAEWSGIKGESVAVMAARMVKTGSPFEGKRAAIQPPPARAHVEALPEVAEPVSEPQDKPTEPIAATVEPEAISAPTDPMAEAISKLEAIKNPSRKVRRELARLYSKQERHAERQQRDPQPTPNRMPAKQIAIAARAYALLQDFRA